MRARAFAALAALAVAGCATSERRDTSDERRAFARLAKDTALVELAKVVPGADSRLARAAGWAAFGVGGTFAFEAKRGDGFGIVHDNKARTDAYMAMSATDAEPFRLVLVFDDAARLRDFAASGGTLESEPPPGVEVYRLIDGSLAPAADLAGTKFKPAEEPRPAK